MRWQERTPFLHSPSTSLHPLMLLQNGNSGAAAGNWDSYLLPSKWALAVLVLSDSGFQWCSYRSGTNLIYPGWANVHPIGLQLHRLDMVIQSCPFSRGSENPSWRGGPGQVGTVMSAPWQLQKEKLGVLRVLTPGLILRSGVSSTLLPGFKLYSIHLEFCRTESEAS